MEGATPARRVEVTNLAEQGEQAVAQERTFSGLKVPNPLK
jgi:hypothetical protein